MSSANCIPLPIGETLQMDLTFSNDDASPMSLMNYSLTSQVRDLQGNFVDSLGITWFSDVPNIAYVSQATDFWPAGTLLCDVRLVELGSGIVTLSGMFSFSAYQPISTGST